MSSNENSDSRTDELLNTPFKKVLRKKVLEQMEFYFSDSNLTKDRFLKQQISNSSDGSIHLTIFLNFNKIRTLGVNLKEIIKSIKKSEFLELNEDKTMVRRKTPFIELSQKDIDKKTIYVENIPTIITYEELKHYFEQYGKISYISLPKFKTTNQSKGFSFIEFEKKDDSKKAVEAFRSQVNELDEERIGKFPKSNAQIIELEKKIIRVKQEIDAFMTIETTENDDKKRKLEIDQSIESNKKKTDIDLDKIKKPKDDRKDKESWIKSLRVVSKKRWLKSKEQYLENQKNEVISLKEQFNQLDKILTDLKYKNSKQESSNIRLDDENRGCVIKIKLDLNNDKDFEIFNMGRKQFKEKCLSGFDEQIAYIDMEKNSNTILIRCKSKESIQSLLSNKSFLENYTKCLLKGEEEDKYLEKIYQNRNKKQEKKERKEKQISNKTV